MVVLSDEYKNSLSPEVIIGHFVEYLKTLSEVKLPFTGESLARLSGKSDKHDCELSAQEKLLHAEAIELTHRLSLATPEQIESIKKMLSPAENDSEQDRKAKAAINALLKAFYDALHKQLSGAIRQYAVDVTTRLKNQLDAYSDTAELAHHQKLKKIIGSDQSKMLEKISNGEVLSLKKLPEYAPSTPSMNEAIFLSNVAKKSLVTEKNENWCNYRESVVSSVQSISTDILDKATEERNAMRVFKNVINSIGEALGFGKIFAVSKKDSFKNNFLAIKEKAGLEEAPSEESKLTP